MTLIEAVTNVKAVIETAIREGGTEAKNNLIRSSEPINFIHEAVKTELINHHVFRNHIIPRVGETVGELEVWGFLKKKSQDVVVVPSDVTRQEESVVLDQTDPLGNLFTSKTLSINVRSQLSSAAKNFDTLYERTFAEAINLHERCPNMVLGEVYLIAVREYNISESDHKRVGFKPLDANIKTHVEKYLKYFELLNNRSSTENDKHKYERVSLILVDFSPVVPKIYTTKADLIRDNLLNANSDATIENLTFATLVPNLMRVYQERFGKPSFIP